MLFIERQASLLESHNARRLLLLSPSCQAMAQYKSHSGYFQHIRYALSFWCSSYIISCFLIPFSIERQSSISSGFIARDTIISKHSYAMSYISLSSRYIIGLSIFISQKHERAPSCFQIWLFMVSSSIFLWYLSFALIAMTLFTFSISFSMPSRRLFHIL